MAEEEIGGITIVSMQSHSNRARPDHSTLAQHEYSLLALEGPAGDPAAAEPQLNGDDPKDTIGDRRH